MKKMKNNNKNYYFFIGTEAELIKLLPVLLELKKRNIHYQIIASGQNNIEKSDLLALLEKKIDIVLFRGDIKQNAAGLLFWFIKTFFRSMLLLKKKFKNIDRKNSILIIHGDTVSTVMGAFLGKIFGFPIAHVEAGLRSFNYFHPFPEEIDRVLASRFVSIHFCPNQWAVNNIKNIKGIKINTLQNTLLDSLNLVIQMPVKSKLIQNLKSEKYFLFIMHRQENLFNDALVDTLVSEITSHAKSMKCLFVVHKPTMLVLKKRGLFQKLQKNKNIILTERLSYIEFMKVLYGCEFIITDGGSNQEESYYFGKPALILRSATERIEGLGENVILSKNNLDTIKDFIADPQKYKRPKVSLKTKPSKIIVDYLLTN